VNPVLTPPRPSARAHRVESAHGVREDAYYWLRDDTRTDPEVLAHLRAENEYTAAVLAPVQPLIEELYAEIVARLKQDDASVPVLHRGYWYAARYETGREYPLYVRWPDAQPRTETVLLDCNALAAGEPFFQLGDYEVSPDNRLMTYAVDTVGRRQFRLYIKDLVSGALLEDRLDNVEPDVAWSDDNRSFLYVEKDPVTLLGHRIRRHVLGTPAALDALIYEEPDESFDLTVERSKSERYLFIGSQSTTSSEWRFADAADPALRFAVFEPRADDHEHQVDHVGERFVVRTNWRAENFRIVSVPVAAHADRSRWRDVIAHDPSVFIDEFEVFDTFIAVSERAGGLRKIRLQRWNGSPHHLAADDPAYTMHLGSNPEIAATKLRYSYTSMTTPVSVFDYDVGSGERELLKREPVIGDFDPARYASEFQWATARDGALIPVSIVYRKDVPRDGSAPLYLYAYGAYGHCVDPVFSSARLSLLDRGFVYAVAHVRGGQEMGRHWYDNGRLLRKMNTFTDFIDCTDFLIAQRYSRAGRIYAAGGSAGGLLVGAVMNMAPHLYGGAVANVPFVDIVTTMLDASIPLTTLEYDEWGNPHESPFYTYMLSYSPYDNLRRQAYPPLLATSGLWDSQVQYFEPAKWVAKLRELKTDANPVLLHVNLEAGHGGKSGRFAHLHEVAREYGFVVALANGSLRGTGDS